MLPQCVHPIIQILYFANNMYIQEFKYFANNIRVTFKDTVNFFPLRPPHSVENLNQTHSLHMFTDTCKQTNRRILCRRIRNPWTLHGEQNVPLSSTHNVSSLILTGTESLCEQLRLCVRSTFSPSPFSPYFARFSERGNDTALPLSSTSSAHSSSIPSRTRRPCTLSSTSTVKDAQGLWQHRISVCASVYSIQNVYQR